MSRDLRNLQIVVAKQARSRCLYECGNLDFEACFEAVKLYNIIKIIIQISIKFMNRILHGVLNIIYRDQKNMKQLSHGRNNE